MMKLLFLACSLLLLACSPHNESYYRTHPRELQEALKNCPAKKPSLLSCEQLEEIGKSINEIGLQLQTNPQAFGKQILRLQETIAEQKVQLAKDKNQAELQASMEKNKQLLEQYLAMAQWLMSPES